MINTFKGVFKQVSLNSKHNQSKVGSTISSFAVLANFDFLLKKENGFLDFVFNFLQTALTFTSTAPLK